MCSCQRAAPRNLHTLRWNIANSRLKVPSMSRLALLAADLAGRFLPAALTTPSCAPCMLICVSILDQRDAHSIHSMGQQAHLSTMTFANKSSKAFCALIWYSFDKQSLAHACMKRQREPCHKSYYDMDRTSQTMMAPKHFTSIRWPRWPEPL